MNVEEILVMQMKVQGFLILPVIFMCYIWNTNERVALQLYAKMIVFICLF